MYCIIILNRISKTVNTKLRENQCGFRANRSCIDQVFTLRNILEQAYEWRQPIIINFIDFEKAFDSIDHDSLWQIIEIYGIPKKIINIVKEMYTHAQCMIKMENTLTQNFNIPTGVRQGCVLSPLLFNLAMNFVLRNTKKLNNGINWRNESLSDLDFADDICLLHNKIKKLQKSTTSLHLTSKKIGLIIDKNKTMIMTNPYVIDSEHVCIQGKNLKKWTVSATWVAQSAMMAIVINISNEEKH